MYPCGNMPVFKKCINHFVPIFFGHDVCPVTAESVHVCHSPGVPWKIWLGWIYAFGEGCSSTVIDLISHSVELFRADGFGTNLSGKIDFDAGVDGY